MTGIVLGTGRAAEESAIVIMTAGYSQFMPEFKIVANDALVNGMKIYPFQALIGTLPINVYNSYHFPMMVDPGEGFAAALVLITIVLFINLSIRLLVWRRRIG
jgi:phosphate transport system permease protein